MRSYARWTAVALLVGLVVAATTAASPATEGRSTGDQASPRAVKKLADPLARARAATAKYANDLEAAKADGYRIITKMIPDMGYHFLNPDITEFDVTKPPILVYVRDGNDWQLVALEWVFPEKPDQRPLPGAHYGSFGAACHYEDGTFVFESNESSCPETSPESDSSFFFWHPELVTMHVWAWYPNPDGLYNGTNRWARSFNESLCDINERSSDAAVHGRPQSRGARVAQ